MNTEVLPGPGVVVRIGAVIAWAEPSAVGPDSTFAAVLERLQATADGRLPADQLGSHLQALLVTNDPNATVPALAAVVPTAGGLLAIAHGWGHIVAEGVSVVGAWTVRQIAPPSALALGRSDVAMQPTGSTSIFDLESGIVPGGGVILTVTPVAPVSPGFAPSPVAVPAASELPAATSGTFSRADVEAAGPQIVSLSAPDEPAPQRAPLPVREPMPIETGTDPVDVMTPIQEVAIDDGIDQGSAIQVQGVVCSRRHFNNPIAAYCRVCGISMIQQTHVLVPGDRPPLGVLVCDDGTTFGLDQDYLVGAAPESDSEVAAGARPLVLGDPAGSVEPVHALVRLDGWTVTLINRSAAGTTWALSKGQGDWTVVPRDTPVRLEPGSQVAVGARRFVFESNARL